jgi:hypothetical protein
MSKKAEREHYARIADIGCVVCLLQGHGYSPCEIHHIRSGAGLAQKSHWSEAIGLCPPHHRTGGRSVAIHAGIESFEAMIGMSELELLDKQLELLNES